MAYLGPVEAARVALVRPELLAALSRVMADFERETGRRTYVPRMGGLRSPAEQQALVDDRNRQGATYRVAPATSSRHTLGAAFDLHIISLTGKPHYHETIGHPLYKTLGAIGERHGLTWGGRWKDRPDDYHFELTETLDESRRAWADLVGRRLQLAGIVAALGAVALLTLTAE